MTQDLPSPHEQRPVDALDETGGTQAELAQVQRHAVELLAQLDRPPRNLRIHAGQVSVDITWADQTTPSGQPASVTELRSVPAGGDRAEPVPGTGPVVVEQYLHAPCVGVFYHSREPGAEPFVSVGSEVRLGQQIGIIEAMKLMIPLEADRAGRILGILKSNGDSVEYAEPIFSLEPGAS